MHSQITQRRQGLEYVVWQARKLIYIQGSAFAQREEEEEEEEEEGESKKRERGEGFFRLASVLEFCIRFTKPLSRLRN